MTPGECAFYQHTVTNPTAQAEVLSVRVEDPEAHFEEEMKLVYYEAGKNEEWPFWHGQGKCAKPAAWDMVSPHGEVWLEAN